MRTTLLLAAALLAQPLAAQTAPPSAEDLLARRTAKLALPVFAKAGFGIDLDAARTLARTTGRPIFAYFTRSYAT